MARGWLAHNKWGQSKNQKNKWGQSKNQKIQSDFVYVDARYDGILGSGHMTSSTDIVHGEFWCRGEGVIARQGYPCMSCNEEITGKRALLAMLTLRLLPTGFWKAPIAMVYPFMLGCS